LPLRGDHDKVSPPTALSKTADTVLTASGRTATFQSEALRDPQRKSPHPKGQLTRAAQKRTLNELQISRGRRWHALPAVRPNAARLTELDFGCMR
jgi:hypothetical protein